MKSSELILNADGSIYHLGLKPEELADTIITVGDQDRVGQVSKHFDTLECTKQAREFVTHTGTLSGKRLTVISTGIGTDNVDVVLNELHALKNIGLTTQKQKDKHTTLTIIRIGTSGAVQKEIQLGSTLVTHTAMGFDSLLHFYERPATESLLKEYQQHFPELSALPNPYFAEADTNLAEKFAHALNAKLGVTITAPGFYAPQGRSVNLKPTVANFIGALENKTLANLPVTNIEMETAGIYGLSALMGHKAVSISALLANRATGDFLAKPHEVIEKLIEEVLGVVVHTVA